MDLTVRGGAELPDSLSGGARGALAVGVQGGELAAGAADPVDLLTCARSTDRTVNLVQPDQGPDLSTGPAGIGVVAPAGVAGTADVTHQEAGVNPALVATDDARPQGSLLGAAAPADWLPGRAAPFDRFVLPALDAPRDGSGPAAVTPWTVGVDATLDVRRDRAARNALADAAAVIASAADRSFLDDGVRGLAVSAATGAGVETSRDAALALRAVRGASRDEPDLAAVDAGLPS